VSDRKILDVLCTCHGMTPREISHDAGLTYGEVRRAARRLERAGLVIRAGVRGRMKMWWLTAYAKSASCSCGDAYAQRARVGAMDNNSLPYLRPTPTPSGENRKI
jgi:DNA-binding transcriptional ArsR family regulator